MRGDNHASSERGTLAHARSPFGPRFALPTAAVVFWALVAVRSRPGSDARRLLVDLGIALLVICVIGALAAWRGGSAGARALREPRTERRTEDPFGETLLIEPAERSRWAEATLGAVSAIALVVEHHDVPDIAVIRVGWRIEVLLNAPCSALPPFQSSAGDLVWTLEPSVGLDVLIDLGHEIALSAERETPSLVEIGCDEEGAYFALAGNVATIHLDDDGIGELGDEFPSFVAGGSGTTSDGVFGAPLVVVERGNQLVLEPFGIALPVSPESSAPHVGETVEEAPSEPVRVPRLEREDVEAEAMSAPAVANGEQRAALEQQAPRVPLVAPGPIEVRILRELPDLVGELCEEPSAGAVEFLAYLALHCYRVTTARLKEALGTSRAQASRSGRSVWVSAGDARRAIGSDLVPTASGNQLYVLSETVSCDWTRFRALVDLAHAVGSDKETRRDALVAALELVDGVPGLASRRFSWLDTEGLLSDIALAVVGAARELVDLEADGGDGELSRWAIGKARPLLPDLGELERQESRYANARAREASHR